MRSVELFTGAGGLALGLSRAGFESALMVEWNQDACDSIRANAYVGGVTHGWPLVQGDVREIDFRALGDDIDLVAGGPPCQPFSIGGKHLGAADPRDMWPQAIRAVRELRPRAFIFENVRGLTRAAFADYLRYIIARLRHPTILARTRESWADHLRRLEKLPDNAGEGPSYAVSVHQVNAADYGAPQKRHRVVIVGIRNDLGLAWRMPLPTHSREALEWDKYVSGDYWRRHRVKAADRPAHNSNVVRSKRTGDLFDRPGALPWVTVRDALAGLPEPREGGCPNLLNHRLQIGAKSYVGHTGSPLDEPAKALKAGDHGVPGGENMLCRPDGTVRYFSIRESARLQGFPDTYEFPGSWSESMRQLGNAVPAQMAEAICGRIAETLRASADDVQRAA